MSVMKLVEVNIRDISLSLWCHAVSLCHRVDTTWLKCRLQTIFTQQIIISEPIFYHVLITPIFKKGPYIHFWNLNHSKNEPSPEIFKMKDYTMKEVFAKHNPFIPQIGIGEKLEMRFASNIYVSVMSRQLKRFHEIEKQRSQQRCVFFRQLWVRNGSNLKWLKRPRKIKAP